LSYPASESLRPPGPRGGRLHRNRWQPSRGISGSLAVEWVAAFLWNQWQTSSGIRSLKSKFRFCPIAGVKTIPTDRRVGILAVGISDRPSKPRARADADRMDLVLRARDCPGAEPGAGCKAVPTTKEDALRHRRRGSGCLPHCAGLCEDRDGDRLPVCGPASRRAQLALGATGADGARSWATCRRARSGRLHSTE